MFMVAPRTAGKWADRYRDQGPADMLDRSSRPRTSPRKIPEPVVRQIAGLRWRQRIGPVQIGGYLGIAPSTVHAVLALPDQPALPHRPGHRDRNHGPKLGNAYGYTVIDDESRVAAYAEICADENDATAIGVLHCALTWFCSGSSPTTGRPTAPTPGLRSASPEVDPPLPAADQRQDRTVPLSLGDGWAPITRLTNLPEHHTSSRSSLKRSGT